MKRKDQVTTILSDLRYAMRQLRRDPGFSLVAILTLGVGIGATTTVFTVFNPVVLHDLPYQEAHRLRRAAWVLFGAVGLLLLMACASVSSLLLARTIGRQREFALRATLGALPPRILEQVIVEALALALVSGTLGMLFAAWAVPLVQALQAEFLPKTNAVTIDWAVVLFAIFITAFTGLLCGVAQAYEASHNEMDQTLRTGERIVIGKSRTIRDVLVIFQLALAVVLLVGAGLLANSFVRLLDNDQVRSAAGLSNLRLNATLMGLFAAAALGMAALGVYAVTAFSVARRKREIGVRMALGAAPARIIGVAITSGTKLVVFGTAIGLLGAFGLSRFLRSLLYEIGPNDPLTYASVTLVLILVATVANFLPAHRATKIDPRTAFVSE